MQSRANGDMYKHSRNLELWRKESKERIKGMLIEI